MRYYLMKAAMKAKKISENSYMKLRQEGSALTAMITTRTEQYNQCVDKGSGIKAKKPEEVFYACVSHYSETAVT